ncbi:MAG TPA: HEAT repeat domain-containing protein [Candidatus Sulfotelmatobacter sp.]|nr:HEAT repeat domain-containing protein [Candidatus Sulfotelmatobacter sp.]
MGVPPQFGPGKDPQVENSQINGGPDPRLQPTPDYGTLGPGSDIAAYNAQPNPGVQRKVAPQWLHLIAMAIGMIGAVVAGSLGHAHRVAPKSESSNYESRAGSTPGQIQDMGAQRQAETLLEQAVAHSPDAVDQISSKVNEWQGKLQWDSQMANVTTAALNSDDMRVRESGVEVELAAYGLSKNSQGLQYLLKTADSGDHGQKIWALWALGLMANRGVEPTEVVEVLKQHLSDSDVESRHWSVEALALTGTDDALAALLKAMHDDASPLVRERAACGVASSGLFTPQQRATAIPHLIEYADDPSLDAATHAWAFHALSDITHQRLGNDSAAWRQWYQNASGQ